MGNYLGRGLDRISNIEILDNLVFDNSSSYSITKNSVAFAPNSSQSCLLSIDGVVQATNFTVNSSTIDFGVAIPSTSVCNFFLHYGTGLITVPSDGSVTESKIGSNAVTSAKMFSGFANGITMADQWRVTSNFTFSSSGADITSNLSRVNTSGQGTLGTGMTESSGIFTFPSTGLYKINFNMQGFAQADDNVLGYIYTTTNNSSYNADAIGYFCGDGSTQGSASALAEYFFNVTNTSTHKIKFNLTSIASTTSGVFGSTTINNTCFTFIRLGDSV